MIYCEKCKSKLKTVDSRDWDNNTTIRRKTCPKCGAKYVTREKITYRLSFDENDSHER